MELLAQDVYLYNANLWQIVHDYMWTAEQQAAMHYAIAHRDDHPKMILYGVKGTGKST
jgi:hypothetical protein